MYALLGAIAPYLPLFMPFVGWPLVSALINLAFYKRTPAEWEAWALKKPVLAFLVELCRANGWDIAKNARVLQRFAARRSGQVPEEGWDRLPLSPAVKAALQDPALRGALEEFVAARLAPRETVSPPAPSGGGG